MGIAFAHFLNYAQIAEMFRQDVKRNRGVEIHQLSIEKAYDIAAYRFFKDMLPQSDDAEHILQECFSRHEHPALTALALVQNSYKKNVKA